LATRRATTLTQGVQDEATVRERIRYTLQNSPDATITTLAGQVRPYDRKWRLVLEQMVLDGEVIRDTVISDTRTGGVHVTFIHNLPRAS
jgi:hypothetical protein